MITKKYSFYSRFIFYSFIHSTLNAITNLFKVSNYLQLSDNINAKAYEYIHYSLEKNPTELCGEQIDSFNKLQIGNRQRLPLALLMSGSTCDYVALAESLVYLPINHAINALKKPQRMTRFLKLFSCCYASFCRSFICIKFHISLQSFYHDHGETWNCGKISIQLNVSFQT